jgi:hypothetical protein
MRIPILNGIGADALRPDFRTAYPLNFVVVPKSQTISEGYLRPADGIIALNSSTPGPDRSGYLGLCSF